MHTKKGAPRRAFPQYGEENKKALSICRAEICQKQNVNNSKQKKHSFLSRVQILDYSIPNAVVNTSQKAA